MKKYFDIREKSKVIYNPGGFNSPFDLMQFDDDMGTYLPSICMHGGSGWLCNECSAKFFYEWQNNIVDLKCIS